MYLSIRPGEQFPIARQLEDPLDSGTYYMRAVARWADTDVVVPIQGAQHLDLTDYGSQRFKGVMDVPADKSGGLGSYLAITTTVYSDSGYTTVADNYGIKEVVYLVMDRRNPYQGMGGEGGAPVDYKKIREIVKEEIPAPMGTTEPDYSPIIDALSSLKDSIDDIRIPEMDTKPILEKISTAQKALAESISSIKIPEPEKVDLSPVIEKIEGIQSTLMSDEYVSKIDALFERIKKFFGNDVEEIKETGEGIMKYLKSLSFTMTQNEKTEDEE